MRSAAAARRSTRAHGAAIALVARTRDAARRRLDDRRATPGRACGRRAPTSSSRRRRQPAPWQPALVAPRGGRARLPARRRRRRQGAAAGRRPDRARGSAARGCRRDPARALGARSTSTSSALAHGLLGDVPDPLVPVSAKPAGRHAPGVLGLDRGSAHAGRGRLPRHHPRGRRRPSATACASPTSRCRASARSHTWFLVWARPRRRGRAAARARPPPTRAVLARYGIGDGTVAGGDAAVGLRPDIARRRRVRRDAAAARPRRRAAPPSACAATPARRRPVLLRLRRAAARPARRRSRRWGEALARAAPGVRQLVTATTDPALGRTVGAWSMHLRRAHARDARDHARGSAPRPGSTPRAASRRAARRCCSTSTRPATSPSRRRPGCRAARGLLYWSVNDYTGDPYRDPLNHGEEAGRVEQRRRRPALSRAAVRPAARRTRRCASRSSPRACRSPTRRRCSRAAATATRRGRCSGASSRAPPSSSTTRRSWQNVERALLRRLERTS